MVVKPYEETLMRFAAYRLHKKLSLYAPPVLLILGTLGNAFSVVVLTRKSMRRRSTYFYLTVLAVTDTVVLYVGLLRLWLGELTGEDVRNTTDWACKVISFFGYALSDFSAWLIIAVTVERWLAVCLPLRATRFCTREKAVRVVIALFVILLLINCHFFWTVHIVHIPHGEDFIPHCEAADQFRTLIDGVWPWMDAFIYSFLPFVTILLLNTLIIRKVLRAKHNRRVLQFCGRGKTLEVQQPFSATDSGRTTIMLLTVSFSFLVTTLPMNVTLIATRFLAPNIQDLGVMVVYRLVRTIMELLMYVNHSINFYLYCAAGRKFRDQLVRLIHNRKPPQAPPELGSAAAISVKAVQANLITSSDIRPELVPLQISTGK